METVSPSFTAVSREPRYRTSSSLTYRLTNRWMPPYSVTTLCLKPGYRLSRSSRRARSVEPLPSTTGSPPTWGRMMVGTFTFTGMGIQASVTGTLLAGKEHGGLPVELVDRPVDQWFAEHLRGVVHQISNGEVVRTVHHDVVLPQDLERVVRIQHQVVPDHVDIGVDGVDPVRRRVHLGPAHVVGVVQELALEIGQVHAIEVGDPQGPHARCGQIHRRGRPEAARSDTQDLRLEQLALPGRSNLGQDDVPRITQDLLLGERGDAHTIFNSSSATLSASSIQNARMDGSWSFSETMTYRAPP